MFLSFLLFFHRHKLAQRKSPVDLQTLHCQDKTGGVNPGFILRTLSQLLSWPNIIDVVIPGSFGHTRLDRVSGSPIVVGDDIGVAILDILFGYADVVIGNVHFPSFSQSQFRVALFCRDSFVVIWIWLYGFIL